MVIPGKGDGDLQEAGVPAVVQRLLRAPLNNARLLTLFGLAAFPILDRPTSKIHPEEESKDPRVASEGSSNAIKRFCSRLRREGELIKLRRENEL